MNQVREWVLLSTPHTLQYNCPVDDDQKKPRPALKT